jgi:hypothetical protein
MPRNGNGDPLSNGSQPSRIPRATVKKFGGPGIPRIMMEFALLAFGAASDRPNCESSSRESHRHATSVV